MTDEGLRLLQRTWRTLDPAKVAAQWRARLGALDPERLVELAAEWGSQPVALELSSRHHVLLGDALRESLRELLGPAWNPALQAAWLEAAILVSSVMRRSALRASGEWPRPVAPVERE